MCIIRNHDNAGYNAGWGETYMGLDADGGATNFVSASNQHYAANLKVPEPVLVVQTEIAVFSDRDGQGKLLLIHGEMDENVHYSLTMKLVRTTADIVVVSQSIDGSI
jgi:hypothetical protein